MTQARSEHGEFRFRVKEFGDGTPFLAAEPVHFPGTMTLLSNHAQMFLELRSGTNIHQAQRIADYLNENIAVVGFTLFGEHPMFSAAPVKP